LPAGIKPVITAEKNRSEMKEAALALNTLLRSTPQEQTTVD
jgi:hypothetical protein